MKILSIFEDRNKAYLVLFVMIFTAFVIRLWLASQQVIGAEEGNYLYDANLILDGKMPFKDFETRSPFIMYSFALLFKIFGVSIMAERVLGIFAVCVSSFFIFKIGEEIANHKIAFLSAFLFLFTPYSLFRLGGGYTISIIFQLMLVTISMYFFVIAIKNENNVDYLLSGIFIGLGVLARRSAAVFLFVIPLFLFFYYKREIKKIIKNYFIFLIGFISVFSLVLSYFIATTSFECMWGAFGPGGVVTAATRSHGYHDLFFKLWVVRTTFGKNLLFFFLCIMSFFFIVKLLDRNQKHIYFFKKTGLIMFLILLPILFISFIIIGLCGTAPFQDILAGVFPELTKTRFPNFVCGGIVFLLCFVPMSIFFFIHLMFNHEDNDTGFKAFPHAFLIVWLLGPFLFYVFYPYLYFGYLTELLPPICLFSSLAVYKIFSTKENAKKNLTIFIIFLLLLFTWSAGPHFFNETARFNTANEYRSISTAKEVSEYIEDHTSIGEEIFTARTDIVSLANRKLVLDISHPAKYCNPSDVCSPSIENIIEYIEQHRTNYVIIDPVTESRYLMLHPNLAEYIYSHYILEKEFRGGIDVYVRKSRKE